MAHIITIPNLFNEHGKLDDIFWQFIKFQRKHFYTFGQNRKLEII